MKNFEYYGLRYGKSESLAHTAAKAILSFSFVDCIYVSMRMECGIRQVAVYVMLAYDTNRYKDILGLWINETERSMPRCRFSMSLKPVTSRI